MFFRPNWIVRAIRLNNLTFCWISSTSPSLVRSVFIKKIQIFANSEIFHYILSQPVIRMILCQIFCCQAIQFLFFRRFWEAFFSKRSTVWMSWTASWKTSNLLKKRFRYSWINQPNFLYIFKYSCLLTCVFSVFSVLANKWISLTELV